MEPIDARGIEQLEHVAKMFNVRTQRKRYENFIVNTIYAYLRMDYPNLIPVTQQFVKKPNDPRKHYFLDLYFPQINYGIEIDEKQHNLLGNSQLDKIREIDIMNAIECEEFRIPIMVKDKNENWELRTLSEIYGDIHKVVSIIKQKIADKEANDGKPLEWETNKDRKMKVIDRGSFDISDDVIYDTITEIYNMCGRNAKSVQRCGIKLNENYQLWVPKLTVEYDDTSIQLKHNFKNYLSEDGTRITEQAENGKKFSKQDPVDRLRVVFMRMKDKYGSVGIKFVGIFKQVKFSETECKYERVGERVALSALKN